MPFYPAAHTDVGKLGKPFTRLLCGQQCHMVQPKRSLEHELQEKVLLLEGKIRLLEGENRELLRQLGGVQGFSSSCSSIPSLETGSIETGNIEVMMPPDFGRRCSVDKEGPCPCFVVLPVPKTPAQAAYVDLVNNPNALTKFCRRNPGEEHNIIQSASFGVWREGEAGGDLQLPDLVVQVFQNLCAQERVERAEEAERVWTCILKYTLGREWRRWREWRG